MRRPFFFPAVVALLTTACPHVAQADADADAEAAPYSVETQTLESLVAIASTPGFALLVEPAASRLALTLEGALLRECPIQATEVVAPRILFWWRSRATASDSQWVGRVWHGGELDPPRKRDRIEFTAAPPDPKRPEGSVEVPVPPPLEESIVVPDRYFVRFQGGFALEIRATADGDKGRDAWRLGWEDRWAALPFHPRDGVRVRLHLAPDDADALYRSLPPDVRALVLPATLSADGTLTGTTKGT